jgi:hypothetical protein
LKTPSSSASIAAVKPRAKIIYVSLLISGDMTEGYEEANIPGFSTFCSPKFHVATINPGVF